MSAHRTIPVPARNCLATPMGLEGRPDGPGE